MVSLLLDDEVPSLLEDDVPSLLEDDVPSLLEDELPSFELLLVEGSSIGAPRVYTSNLTTEFSATPLATINT